MIIRKQSPLTGEINEMELDVTPLQLQQWNHGGLIQNIMPHLTVDQREFLMTGTYPGEWLAYMKRIGAGDED
jgi:Na+-transporting NADH:ubiquinone oxidoreductase subunit NqrF